MISLIYSLGLLILFGIGNRMYLTQHCPTSHVSLITDIRREYGCSSIFFSSTLYYQSTYEWMIFAYKLSNDLSRNGISSVAINLDKLNEIIIFYRNRILRPIIVVILNTKDDIAQFERLSKIIDMEYPIWLIIFTNINNNSLCDYCIDPNANKFTLTINVEMLVYCCCKLNGQLNEWWSSDGIHTETTYFGSWTLNSGLNRSVNNGIYNRRSNLNGRNLKVIYVNESSSSMSVNNGKITGYLGEFLIELSDVMNFTILPLISDRKGITNAFSYGRADIGATQLDMNSIKDRMVSYTLPLMLTTYRLYFKQENFSHIKWSIYFQLFDVKIWMAMMMLIVLASFILTIIKYNTSTYCTIPILIFENYLHIWGIFCQQGVSETPSRTPLRIVYFSMCLLVVVLSSSFSASFISSLAVRDLDLPFNSFYEFTNEKSYNLIVCKDSAEYQHFVLSENPMLKKALTKMQPVNTLPITVAEGLEQVCSKKVVFFVAEMRQIVAEPRPPCKLSSIDTGVIAPIPIITSLNSHYTGLINYHIHKLQQAGFLQRLKAKYLLKNNIYGKKSKFFEVPLQKVAPSLILFAAGAIIAAICLLMEKLYYFCVNCCFTEPHNLTDLKVKQFQDSFTTFKAKRRRNKNIPLKFKAMNNPRKLSYPIEVHYL